MISAFFKLPELIKAAKLVKTTDGEKLTDAANRGVVGSVSHIYRFLLPVGYGEKTYVLKFTAKEYEGGRGGVIVEIDDPDSFAISLYDQNIGKEIKKTPDSPQQVSEETSPAGRQLDISSVNELSIGEMAVEIKDTVGNEPYLTRDEYESLTGEPYRFLNQPDNSGVVPNANIELLDSGRSIITLFEKTNASTLPHEFAHHMLDVLVRLRGMEGINETFAADIDLALSELGVSRDDFLNDAELRKAAQEKFARLFEIYL
jgi:hypothetical protein